MGLLIEPAGGFDHLIEVTPSVREEDRRVDEARPAPSPDTTSFLGVSRTGTEVDGRYGLFP